MSRGRRAALWTDTLTDAVMGLADEQLRCGVCDQPSSTPVCRKCATLLVEERFGPLRDVSRERRS